MVIIKHAEIIDHITIIGLIKTLCCKYQQERVNGHWYITQTGLNKICQVLGGDYTELTKKQRQIFRSDCINVAQGEYNKVKTWFYYTNCV